ncbi:hypothetical protein TRICI_006363 [Trichomonascus ciferrii]|uniref:Phosphoglycerate mutase n=1 Tax=Trichomonascus ciferrii TaxID=44093 RepID=A0A642UJS2_9ASCO|nr:hypothetical protein TRICI_006363 [Trichomonascus ciferrii]
MGGAGQRNVSERVRHMEGEVKHHHTYESVGRGFLAQDDPKTSIRSFNYLESDFGLVKRSWEEFKRDFDKMCEEADENTRYKVLYLARHGQGEHNALLLKHGDNVDLKRDPELTSLGVQQGKNNNAGWKEQIKKGIPLPQSLYVSPFTRCLDTMYYTWDGILLNVENSPVEPPLMMEDLREDIDYHTCNQRNVRSYYEKKYPGVIIEAGFTEEDELFTGDDIESLAEHNVRTTRFLDKLFDWDWDSPEPHKFVSVTSHYGTVESFLSTIGHVLFPVGTGDMVPVIVKATRVD